MRERRRRRQRRRRHPHPALAQEPSGARIGALTLTRAAGAACRGGALARLPAPRLGGQAAARGEAARGGLHSWSRLPLAEPPGAGNGRGLELLQVPARAGWPASHAALLSDVGKGLEKAFGSHQLRMPADVAGRVSGGLNWPLRHSDRRCK